MFAPKTEIAEHRREQRFSLNPGTTLPVKVVLQDGTVADGTAGDISFSGAKIKLGTALPPKSLIELTIDGILTREAEVCWCRPASEDTSWVGCRFDDPLCVETIDRLAENGVIDRRQDDRRLMSVGAMARYQNDGELRPVHLVNMSAGGFSLITADNPVDLQRLMLTVTDQRSKQPLSIPARIAWMMPVESGYQLGCQFVMRDSFQKLHTALVKPSRSVLSQWRPQRDRRRTAILVALLVMTWSLWLLIGD